MVNLCKTKECLALKASQIFGFGHLGCSSDRVRLLRRLNGSGNVHNIQTFAQSLLVHHFDPLNLPITCSILPSPANQSSPISVPPLVQGLQKSSHLDNKNSGLQRFVARSHTHCARHTPHSLLHPVGQVSPPISHYDKNAGAAISPVLPIEEASATRRN